jgi:hypothetical protein
MESNEWTPPPAVVPADGTRAIRRRRGLVAGAGLVGAGVVAGAIVGTTLLSGAATTTTPTPGTSSSASQQEGHHGPGRGLGLSGTVTAVGASSVTIKTGTATTTYKVGSNSDIDKNGEAQLSDLKVGDAVLFSVDSGNVIDKLHAGNEALNHPQRPSNEGTGG